jgi:Arc/MetJ-type ribon-helix-helix transcriptional regulator
MKESLTQPQQPMPATIMVRLPGEIAEWLALEVKRLRQERPGARASVSDVVRDTLFRAMQKKP